jgi:hypothetical protein
MRKKLLLLFFVVFVIYYLLFYFIPGTVLCVLSSFFAIGVGKVWAINAPKVAFLAVLLAAFLYFI